ncbi:MAG: hypothetical protein ACI8Y7_000223 [Candidatus Woesearchaeota archaeon]|jgi:hypothetical protein
MQTPGTNNALPEGTVNRELKNRAVIEQAKVVLGKVQLLRNMLAQL